MLKTFTSKFTFFFWLIFSITTIPIYLFSTTYVKNIFQNIEQEKIELMLNTLKASIALDLSFNQQKQLNTLLQTILKEKNIQKVSLYSHQFQKEIFKESIKNTKLLHFSTSIKDPFNKKTIAQISIYYTNENALALYKKTTKLMLFLFIFALFIFLSFYFSIKKELNALKYIASTLQVYSQKKQIVSIETPKVTQEIQTISSVANEMMQNISTYLQKLESFNSQLEIQVKEKVQELQKQEKVMIHQSRQAAMGEMLESIAHQWRQPLNIIGLSCASLETEYQLGVMQDKNFYNKMEIISDNINYMSNTIDDFRNFLNPDRELSLFCVKQTIDDVLKILHAQLENNNITLTLDEKTPIQLYGIENEFKQVLFVLINNAKDAIKSALGKKSITQGILTIKIYQDKEENIITFCDNGGGIQEEIISSIFDPYFSTKFASSGTGIGLYIAKNIVESRMQGKLYVNNTKDGCCFYITQAQKIQEEL